jgi:hypothetical protein
MEVLDGRKPGPGDILGLPLTPPGIEVLDGRKPGPGDVLGCMHYPL